ncbi:polysaccharide pyruvyl transferase family protein [Marinigracilibium pacificum]|uniref:Polysaccharide pyruvyl transferase domain-containing protein n=1 Tax=Marinigracilibium pacificum TaxID=2729599 RepID=A0A848J386_9BACT|nr:polysaccharide pyruvyl transferase family protein [Marinigracilibium pacificum]NMM48809.1 hypothetical protein [Marinigracilibium pacificum]
MPEKILVKGYYGFGNFGDDVLMVTTINLIKEICPEAELYVFSNSKQNEYLERLIVYPFEIIDWRYSGNFDYIVHGGGGIYFDFKEGRLKDLFINSIIRIFGLHNYSKFFYTVKRRTGGSIITCYRRLGLGIGVGSFTSSSRKFRDSAVELGSFDFMAVRDKRSFKRINDYNLNTKLFEGIDLAFLKDFWLPNTSKSDQYKGSDKIGFILRNWDEGNQYIDLILKDIEQVKELGYNISLILFDKNYDEDLFKYKSHFDELIVWNPLSPECDLSYFLQKLSEYKLLITSRAHGAIIPANLGVPSIIIEIEEKLRNVHEMLKSSSQLIKLNQLGNGELKYLIDESLKNIEALNSGVDKDLDINRSQGELLINAVKENW